MARFPESSASSGSEDKTDISEDSEKKRKFGRAVAAKAGAGNAENAPQPEQSKPRTLSELIDEARARKAEKAASKTEKDSPAQTQPTAANDHESVPESEQPTSEQSAEQSHTEITEPQLTDGQETTVADSTETVQDDDISHEQDKPANSFYGGEVITIQLNGDAPVAEHVVPLHSGGREGEHPSESAAAAHSESLDDASTESEENVNSDGMTQVKQHYQLEAPAPNHETVLVSPALEGDTGELLAPTSPELANAPAAPERSILTPPVEVLHTYQPGDSAESGGPAPGNIFASPAATRPVEQLATKQDVDDVYHQAVKRSGQRGLLAGFIGGRFATRKVRKRQKIMDKELAQQAQELVQVKQELRATQNTQQFETNRNERNLRTVEKRFDNTPRPEKIQPKMERFAKPEVRSKPQSTEPQEQLQIPENHHLETSAWHAIEVDNKTGKPVEQASFQYGREYYRERAKEATPKAQRNARAGEAALVAAALSQSQAGGGQGSTPAGASLQSLQVPTATTQGVPSNIVQQTPDADSSDSPHGSAGPIWPWIVALIAVAICLVITLR